MTLEQLLQMLEDGSLTAEQFKEAKTIISGAIDAEKTKGIDSYRKKDAEGLKLKKALKDLGYSKDEVDGVDEFVSGLKNKITAVDGKDVTIAELKSSVEAIQQTLEAEKAEKSKLAETSITNTAKAKLIEALGDKFSASTANTLIENLLLKKAVTVVDDKVVFKNGEEIVPFDDGVKGLLETHKDSLKNQQRLGSQTTPSSADGAPKKLNDMSPEDALKSLGF